MSHFVWDSKGHYVNLDLVEKIENFRHKDREYAVCFDSEGREIARLLDSDDSAQRPAPAFIPNTTGIELVCFWGRGTESDPIFIMQEPIIAWRLDCFGVQPVSLEDLPADGFWCYKCPGGRCVFVEDVTFQSVQEALDHVRDREAARLKTLEVRT